MTFLSSCDGYWCGPSHKKFCVCTCMYISVSLSPFFSAQIISEVNGGETLTQYVLSFSAYPYNEIDEKD